MFTTPFVPKQIAGAFNVVPVAEQIAGIDEVHDAESNIDVVGLAAELGTLVFVSVKPTPLLVTVPEFETVQVPFGVPASIFTEFTTFVTNVQLVTVKLPVLLVFVLANKWCPLEEAVFELNVQVFKSTEEFPPEEKQCIAIAPPLAPLFP